MSLVLNMVGGGGVGSALIVLYVSGRRSNTTYDHPNITYIAIDPSYFVESTSGVYTCQKAGTYNVTITAKSVYGSGSSTRTTCKTQLYKNGSAVDSITSSASSSVPDYKTISVSLAVGDTIEIKLQNSSAQAGAVTDANLVVEVSS